MKITYKTQGTCSSHIEVEVEDDVIQQVFFWGGCNGNLQGISRLVKGMKVEEVLQKLEGVKCGNRSTSCPARAADVHRPGRDSPPLPHHRRDPTIRQLRRAWRARCIRKCP